MCGFYWATLYIDSNAKKHATYFHIWNVHVVTYIADNIITDMFKTAKPSSCR